MNQTEIDILEQTYFVAFRPYTSKQISEATTLWMAEAEYYPPKPRDILSKIPDSAKIKNDEFLRKKFTCWMCHQKMSAITSEGICLDCAGIPDVHYKRIRPLPESEPMNYKMEGRIRCSKCGSVGIAIKEPKDELTASWLCRKCYTGKTTQEIVNAWKELANIMEKSDNEAGNIVG